MVSHTLSLVFRKQKQVHLCEFEDNLDYTVRPVSDEKWRKGGRVGSGPERKKEKENVTVYVAGAAASRGRACSSL